MTKCSAVNPEADSECREIGTFEKVVKLARTGRAREKAEKVKGKTTLNRMISHRTTVLLNRIMLICQPVAQGRPLQHRAQPRQKKIAVALDRVTWIRTSTALDRMMMS